MQLEKAGITAEDLKALYDKLDKKGAFVQKLANELGKTKKYLTNYWFPSCGDITEKHKQFVFDKLKETIENQPVAHKSLSNN